VIARVAILAVLVSTAAAAAKPMRPPRCTGPSAWDAIAKCMAGDQPYLDHIEMLSEHLRAFTDDKQSGGRIYVQGLDGTWRTLRTYRSTLRVVEDGAVIVKVNAAPVTVRRIELRELLDLGERQVVRMRSAIVCGAPGVATCQERAYDCTAIADGRVVGVVKGAIEIAQGDVRVVGDLSRAGELCRL
jgi:hypothetical protein